MINRLHLISLTFIYLLIDAPLYTQTPCEAEMIQFDQEYCGQTEFNITNPPASQTPCPVLVGSSAWYQVAIGPNDPGIEIDFIGEECCEYQMIVGRFSNGCDGTFLFENKNAFCFEGSTNKSVYCLDPGIYFVYVGTTSVNQGEFCLTTSIVATPQDCQVSFDCNDPIEIPISANNELFCVDGCNIGACGEGFSFSGCNYNNGVAWYKVRTRQFTTGLNVSVISHDKSILTPQIQIFSDVCGSGAIGPCLTGQDGSVNAMGVNVLTNTDYYIAVTNASWNPGYFELCISLTTSQTECLIESSLVVNSASFGSPPTGPFFPGETVSFTFHWTFSSIGNGIQWPHAVIPVFGNCWNLEASNLPNFGNWTWFDEGIVTYNIENSFIFTYTDPYRGDQKLCYWLDPTCEGESLTSGTTMPAGWYHINQPGQCGNDLSNPNNTWGHPCGGICENYFSFTLTTVDFETCSDNSETNDCGIQFFVMSDYQTGCWQTGEPGTCLNDLPHFFNANLRCCSGCSVYTDSPDNTFELCSCAETEIFLYADESGPNTIYSYTAEAPSGIFGASHGQSPDAIRQVLCNTTSDTLDVYYFVGGTDSIGCYSAEETMITVRVLPAFEVAFDNYSPICVNDSIMITPNITGGNGLPFQYLWEDSITSEHYWASESQPGLYRYDFTVQDTSGCKAHGMATIRFVQPPIDWLEVDINDDDLGTITYAVGNPGDYTYTWSTGDTGHQISDVSPGTYFVTVTNMDGCSSVFDIAFQTCNIVVTANTIDFFTCEGVNDGYLNVNAVNGHGNVSFVWNDGFIGKERDSLGAGTYIVTATDEFGCQSEASFLLEPKKTIDLELEDQYYFCKGQSVSISIDRPVQSVTWSDGQTDPTINVSNSGQISVIAIDEDGCIGRDTIEILTLPLPFPNIEIPKPYICHDDTITVCTDDFYDIYWSTESSDPCIEVSGESQVSLQAWSNEGCFRDTVFDLPALPDPIEIDYLEIAHPSTASTQDGYIILTLKGGIEPYYVEWYSEDELIQSDVMEINSLSPGLYYLHISDALGCTKRLGPFTLEFNTSTKSIESLDIKLFPNPFDDRFIVEFSSSVQPNRLSVRDLNGKVIYSSSNLPTGTTIEIPSEQWPSGNYSIEIIFDEGRWTHQVIKQ